MEFLENLVFWHWLILAVVLIVLEIFAPGLVFMWIGVAAGLTGVLLISIPNLIWEYQLLFFAVLAGVSIVLGRKFVSRKPPETDHPNLNRRGEQYVGRTYTLDESIVDGEGRLVIDDTSWKTAGNDMPRGTRVRVVGMDGMVLQVEKERDV